MARLTLARAEAADALRRDQGLGRARRRLADVNEVTADTFSVLIIPHTLSVTTLGAAKPGDTMNLEIDLMARYAARLMETK